jgi:hypothetical protein
VQVAVQTIPKQLLSFRMVSVCANLSDGRAECH